jgi:hypothetical protein
MLLDKIAHSLSVISQSSDGRFFIVVHETTVAFDIGTEDGGEFALKAFVSHAIPPFCYDYLTV